MFKKKYYGRLDRGSKAILLSERISSEREIELQSFSKKEFASVHLEFSSPSRKKKRVSYLSTPGGTTYSRARERRYTLRGCGQEEVNGSLVFFSPVKSSPQIREKARRTLEGKSDQQLFISNKSKKFRPNSVRELFLSKTILESVDDEAGGANDSVDEFNKMIARDIKPSRSDKGHDWIPVEKKHKSRKRSSPKNAFDNKSASQIFRDWVEEIPSQESVPSERRAPLYQYFSSLERSSPIEYCHLNPSSNGSEDEELEVKENLFVGRGTVNTQMMTGERLGRILSSKGNIDVSHRASISSVDGSEHIAKEVCTSYRISDSSGGKTMVLHENIDALNILPYPLLNKEEDAGKLSEAIETILKSRDYPKKSVSVKKYRSQ